MITKINHFKESFGYNVPQVQPKTKEELIKIIQKTRENSLKGDEVDLNFIDTSLITDISDLFFYLPNFNGDISKWDVSNVTNMNFMFYGSKFNKDISKWDVSSVTEMKYMFSNSEFNGDISKWNVSNVIDMKDMFWNSPLQSNPPTWYKK